MPELVMEPYLSGLRYKSRKIIDIEGLTGIDSKCVVSVSMPGNDGLPRYQIVIDQ